MFLYVMDYRNVETIRAMNAKFAVVEPLLTRVGLRAERLEDDELEPYWMLTLASDTPYRE